METSFHVLLPVYIPDDFRFIFPPNNTKFYSMGFPTNKFHLNSITYFQSKARKNTNSVLLDGIQLKILGEG